MQLFWFALLAVVALSQAELLGGGSWCQNGAVTKTTNECICSTHTGHFCQGSSCESGFGMSFYPKSCSNCKCELSSEWLERKKALNLNRPGGKRKGKGKKGKKMSKELDD
mmetsp:Transcript_23105/g.33849  ORF Transcript_23105/g.33849 Transcript_23105/m.33849 type:complete len:110 (-) Transcript_23105:106-435(-)